MTDYPAYGQQPYGQQPYGAGSAPSHHQSTTVLVLGILGLLLCQVVAPFAWIMGNRVVREIDASGGRVGGRDAANVGRVLGIVGTLLLILIAFLFLGFIVFAIGILSTAP